MAFERKLGRTITLEEIKQHADALGEGFAADPRGNRLSVLPITAAQWKLLLSSCGDSYHLAYTKTSTFLTVFSNPHGSTNHLQPPS